MNRAFNKIIKQHAILAIFTFVAVVLLASTVTYAVFQIDKENTTNQTIAVGTLSASISSIKGAVILNDIYPKLSTELTDDDKYYEFTIANDGDCDLKYEVYLKDATDTFLTTNTEYSQYERLNTDYYKYINFILDDRKVQNLASVLDGDKFTLMSGTMAPNDSSNHKIRFFIDKGETTTGGAPNELSGSILSLDILLDTEAYDKKLIPLTTQLISKANKASITDYNSGNKGEMFTFSHNELTTTSTYYSKTYTHSATQIMDWTEEERIDYRYIGNTPNNYIDFNGETWRIIGVFTVENERGAKEQRVKIIRDEAIGNISWNSNGVNEWSTSNLPTLLNSGDYYNRTGTYSTNGFTAAAKSQISPVKWYLGGANEFRELDAPDYYNFERGEITCTTEGNCSGETRSTNTIAEVGLMYPSDYVYTYANGVDNTCYTSGLYCHKGTPSNGWLFNSKYQWTISPPATAAHLAFVVTNIGFATCNNVGDTYFTRPSVYLNSDIAIIGGDGTAGNHYILKG